MRIKDWLFRFLRKHKSPQDKPLGRSCVDSDSFSRDDLHRYLKRLGWIK